MIDLGSLEQIAKIRYDELRQESERQRLVSSARRAHKKADYRLLSHVKQFLMIIVGMKP